MILITDNVQRHLLKSVSLPFDLYQVVKEQIEMELYLRANASGLDQSSYQRFLETENVIEELAHVEQKPCRHLGVLN